MVIMEYNINLILVCSHKDLLTQTPTITPNMNMEIDIIISLFA